MGMMDRMMDEFMGKMSQEDKERLMGQMMEKFFADMTAEDKQNMMLEMMPRMMEGVNMAEMMPQMMMGMMSGMTGGGEQGGGMMQMMANMMAGGQGVPASGDDGSADRPNNMPGMPNMMVEMMPRCLNMMLPGLPREERTEFVLRMIGVLKEQGSAGMSEEEKQAFSVRFAERAST